MAFDHLLASRTHNMGASAIREILKIASQKGMISLAGGMPAPQSFPLDTIKDLVGIVISKYNSKAFQYDLTEGFVPLREQLCEHLKDLGISSTPSEILIGSGSQGVLDALGKILISHGDKIAVEAPTYLGAIQAFNPYEPQYIRMDMDENGLIPESLDEILRIHKVKFVYLVPTFQNPTGRTIPYDRRVKIAEIIQRNNTLLIEDDPYSALRYRGDSIPPIKTLAPDNVVYLGTLSKVLAPGLRIGFHVSPELIRKWLVLVKQGVDLHTSTFNQAIAAEYLAGGHLKAHLPKIIEIYRPKYKAMLDALEKHFPQSFKWSRPDGGMFVWAEGPTNLDMELLYPQAVERKTAYVPGKFFFTQKNEGRSTMRLNFTMPSVEDIDIAIGILADVIRSN